MGASGYAPPTPSNRMAWQLLLLVPKSSHKRLGPPAPRPCTRRRNYGLLLPDFSQRIDTVFFKRHVDEWKTRIATQIQGDLKDNPTGQALADLIHKEQKILAKEVRPHVQAWLSWSERGTVNP